MADINLVIPYTTKLGRKNRKKLIDKLKSSDNEEHKRLLFKVSGTVGLKLIFTEFGLDKLKYFKKEMGPSFKLDNDPIEIKLDTNYYFQFLREFEFFVFELHSSLDLFSIEMNEILSLGIDKPYIYRIKNFLTNNLPDDEITTRVIMLFESPWFEYFHKFRNAITHRSGFGLSSIMPNHDWYLPDDPDIIPSSVKQKKEVIKESENWLKEISSFIDNTTDLLGAKLFDDWVKR